MQLKEDTMITDNKKSQITALYDQCRELPAMVRYKPENMEMTVIVPPPWDTVAERRAISTQETIKEWSKQYPDVVCYCFDSYSTLLYVL